MSLNFLNLQLNKNVVKVNERISLRFSVLENDEEPQINTDLNIISSNNVIDNRFLKI